MAGTLQRGLLVEADLTVLPGMEVCFEVCRERLAREKIKLDQGQFVRFLLGRPLSKGMAALLEQTGRSAEPAVLAGDCAAAYAEALQKAASRPRDGILAFVKDVAGRGGVKVGLLTQLPEEAARTVFADALGDQVVPVCEATANFCVYGWEGWRRAARKLQVRERLCVAICSPASAHGALAASMRVVAMQESTQEHIDCSGVDVFTESFTASVRTAALGLLRIES